MYCVRISDLTTSKQSSDPGRRHMSSQINTTVLKCIYEQRAYLKIAPFTYITVVYIKIEDNKNRTSKRKLAAASDR